MYMCKYMTVIHNYHLYSNITQEISIHGLFIMLMYLKVAADDLYQNI